MSTFRYRYIEPGHRNSLTPHEVEELERDFAIRINGYYALACMTKKQFEELDLKSEGLAAFKAIIKDWAEIRGYNFIESDINLLTNQLYEASGF